MSRRFTPPTRKAFDKTGQAVIDDIYRILNEGGGSGTAGRGAPETVARPIIFSGIEQVRTFFNELNIQTLHAVATRTGSLTIDNVLTMSNGSQILGENYLIEQNDITLYSEAATTSPYAITAGLFMQVWDGAAFIEAGALGSFYNPAGSGVGMTSRTGVPLFLLGGQGTPVSLFPGFGIIIEDDEMTVMNDSAGKIGFWGAAPVAQDTGWDGTNHTPTKTLDATSFTTQNLADVLCTLIETLKTYGIIA